MGYTPPTEIDIGNEAIKRTSYGSQNYTYISKDNPANGSGKITSVEIWAYIDLANVEVATFYVVSGDNLSVRDSEVIGSVIAGAKRTFEVNIDVQAGDYIGIYSFTGKIERDNTGYLGYWYESGDNIPCENLTFKSVADRGMSLYGTGGDPQGKLTIGDSFSIADLLVKNVTKQLSEAFSIVDSKVTKVYKAFEEAFSVVDSFAWSMVLRFFETLSVKDSAIAYLNSLWHKVTKIVGDWTKVEKEKSDWTKVEKVKDDWDKVDKKKGIAKRL